MKTKVYNCFTSKFILCALLLMLFKSSLLFSQTTETPLITHVSVKSGKSYPVNKLNTGVKQLVDRNYTITNVPEYLKGATFIQTANDDKLSTVDSFLSFFVTENVVVYIAYDPRGTTTPEWLNRWTKTSDKLGTSDKDAGHLDIYHKVVRNEERFQPVILGGNLAGSAVGAKTNYLVAAVRSPGFQQFEAEDAFLSGAVVANDHANYRGTGFVDFKNRVNDYIEWTIKIDVPGTYNLGFIYANAGFGDRSLQITDNGSSAGIATFSHVSSSWSSWAFLQGPDIFLSPGIHKIRTTATGTSGPNIDQLILNYLDNYTPVSIAAAYSPGNPVSVISPALIHHAYPNPFSQSTSLFYTVKKKDLVNLSVYTLWGQRIQLLENRIREAGSYKVSFNGDKIAKGVYFYRIQIGNEVQTGKLIKN